MKKYNFDEQLTQIMDSNGAFFAFSNQQFEEKSVPGIEYAKVSAGIICPKSNCEKLQVELVELYAQRIEWELANNTKKDIIWYELGNHESQLSGDLTDAMEALKGYGFSDDEIRTEYNAYFQHCVEHDYF